MGDVQATDPRGDGFTRRSRAPEGFVEAVLAVVGDIPPGRVMTYGGVAAVLGSRGARVVGQVMAYYGADVPWWRVVRASGEPPAGHEERALRHYREEGTPLRTPMRVDMRAALWSPTLLP